MRQGALAVLMVVLTGSGALGTDSQQTRSLYLFEDYSDDNEGGEIAELFWNPNGTVTGVVCTVSGPIQVQGDNTKQGVLEFSLDMTHTLKKRDYPVVLSTITTEGLTNSSVDPAGNGDATHTISWASMDESDDELASGILLRKLLPQETSFQPTIDSRVVSDLIRNQPPNFRKILLDLFVLFHPFDETIRVVFDTKNEERLFDLLDAELGDFVHIIDLPGCTASQSYVDIENIPTDYMVMFVEKLVLSGLVTYVFPLIPGDAGDGEAALLSNLSKFGVTNGDRYTSAETSDLIYAKIASFFNDSFNTFSNDGGVAEIGKTKFKYLFSFKLIGKSEKLCGSRSNWEKLAGVIDFRVVDRENPEELFYIRIDVKEGRYARSLFSQKFNEASDFNREIAQTILDQCLYDQFEKRLVDASLVEIN